MSQYKPNPSCEKLIRDLRLTEECLTSDVERLKTLLNGFAPIFANFVIADRPPGFAPEEVRDGWIGLSLPVRAACADEAKIPVLGAEALHELNAANRDEAARWWENFYILEGKMLPIHPEGYDTFKANISILEFNLECGTLEPTTQ